MDLTLWHEFVIFSNYMNISEAAKRMHLSQSTLSNHIASLEREIGVPLLRRGKTLSLTPAGRAFIRQTPQVFEAYDSALSVILAEPEQDLKLNIAQIQSPNAVSASLQMLMNGYMATTTSFFFDSVNTYEKTAYAVLQDDAIEAYLSFRNIGEVNVIPVAQINTYELLDNKNLVICDDCLARIEEVLA